ncbi:MAG TPA: signal peptidase I [Acholeplasmataceae bacterium]|nr:signal peptidase I [Acholeplasmataceae bacterium]
MYKKIEGLIIVILMLFLFTTLLIRFIGIETFVVESDSMAPKYRVNDLVYIKQIDITDVHTLEVGDVIAFNQNGKRVMHRITYIDDSKIITKGDNNDTNDPEISRDQVFGKVVFNLPFGAHILNVYVWIIIIGIYFVGHMSYKIYLEVKKGKT